MSNQKTLSRRNFIKTAAAAGIGSALATAESIAGTNKANSHSAKGPNIVPTRPFGKTGRQVSMLSLGGIIDFTQNQLLLRQALKMGVTYWDTAERYGYGNSEAGIGKYFAKYPMDRKKVFLVTKSGSTNPTILTKDLDASLARLQTSYVDLYFIHMLRSVERGLNNEIRRWAEKAKAEGKIKLFGFSTHSGMEESLLKASKIKWIDGIMTTYNYRLMHTPAMRRGIDACVDAGIGLCAMKTQASSAWGPMGEETPTAQKLVDTFTNKGYSLAQAKLKAVWENPNIASICSQMSNLTVLMANVAAAVDKTRLAQHEIKLLDRLAHVTRSQYCAGCSEICGSVVAENIPVADIMRYLMYARRYDDTDRGQRLFNRLDVKTRQLVTSVDYQAAEKACPRDLPIGRLMKKAAKMFV